MLYLWILLTLVAIPSANPMTLADNDEVIAFAFKEIATYLLTTKNLDEVIMGNLIYISTELRLGRRFYINLLVTTEPDSTELPTMVALFLTCIALPLTLVNCASILGGFQPLQIDGSNTNVQYAVKTVNEFYARQGDNAVRTLVSVLQAESQIVAGTHYKFTLKLSSGTTTEVCEVEVWARAWLNGGEALQSTKDPVCTNGKRQLVGGESAIDIKDPEVQKALDFAVTALNARENFMYLRKAVSVSRVTSQVVAGISFHFYGVQLSATNCDKMSTHQLNSCAVADGADTQTCDFKVWWQSWTTPEYQINSINCS
ncbi:unnamed protein product [Lymnaea stagnalis]|uniref:Cystatin domain-containing protein n=1 Tax=Lymnaea stagnalis TaxID=6523 RepID=A0AAV2I540_LYMST